MAATGDSFTGRAHSLDISACREHAESMTKLVAEALALPASERAELAHELLLSLSPAGGASESDPTWRAELERRADEVRNGDTSGVTLDEALRKR
jgi:putative addiction module component (TIGR02574 family)